MYLQFVEVVSWILLVHWSDFDKSKIHFCLTNDLFLYEFPTFILFLCDFIDNEENRTLQTYDLIWYWLIIGIRFLLYDYQICHPGCQITPSCSIFCRTRLNFKFVWTCQTVRMLSDSCSVSKLDTHYGWDLYEHSHVLLRSCRSHTMPSSYHAGYKNICISHASWEIHHQLVPRYVPLWLI